MDHRTVKIPPRMQRVTFEHAIAQKPAMRAVRFIVLTTVDSLEFYRWGADDHGIWIPIKEDRCVLRGFAFAPEGGWPEIRRHCPRQYKVGVLSYDELERPGCCTLDELIRMQTTIDSAKPWEPRIGQVVQVTCGPWANLLGRVCKIKGFEARLLLGNAYITLPIAILSPELA